MKKINVLSVIMLMVASLFLVSSCKKKNDPAPVAATPVAGNGAPTITASYYFQAKIDGTWVTYQQATNGFNSGAASANNGSTLYQEEQDAFLSNYPNVSVGGIFIYKTFGTSGPSSSSDYESILGVHSYTFGISLDLPNGTDGAGIDWIDQNGTEWRSDNGSANQIGSTFNMTENIASTNGSIHRITRATFSCKLYDANGNVKTLTDGSFRGLTLLY